MNTTPVLLLGSGVTALGALRALAGVRIPAYVLADEPGFVARSRWYRAAPGRAAAADADLAAYLAGAPWPRAVLMPCSDHWARRVADLPVATRQRFPASVPRGEVLTRLIDKGTFATLLAEIDVDRPVTRCVTTADHLNDLPEAVLAAGFLKPRDSQSFFARYGVKAFRVRDRADALRRAGELIGAGFELLFQEYVPGTASDHVFVDGFRDTGGVVRARFARRRLRMFPPDFGNSSYMVSIPTSEVAPAIANLERLLGHVGYRGVFSAEFKQDPRDGRFKILEVNCRPWWYVEFAARCGVNVCEMAYRDALDLPIGAPPAYQVGRACVYPYYDFFTCRELHRRGELSLRSWITSWLRAMQPVFRWADPRPGAHAAVATVANFLRRRVLRRGGA
jgi:predicted ATP-grasp superfamily ATP-dependent carboligase